MGYIVIAPMGDKLKELFRGVKEFPTERVILVCTKALLKKAHRAVKEFKKFDIAVNIFPIEGNIWEEMFCAIGKIARNEQGKDVIVNIGPADRISSCAATCAAYVNGLRVFDMAKEGPILFPILKFSYYKTLSDKKIKLLGIISQKDCCASLEELAKRTKMSLPLVSYHVNGNLRSDGLKGLGLVETAEKEGKVAITL
ncbi:MAG: DUF6293 family protein, partial [Candidatus Nanoarchaeia archaeon]